MKKSNRYNQSQNQSFFGKKSPHKSHQTSSLKRENFSSEDDPVEKDVTERVQKVLARSGLCSRRQAEQLISTSKIEINGNTAILGDRIKVGDVVGVESIRHRVHSLNPQPKVLLYHKPEGVLTTRDDPQGRKTIFDDIPKRHRWIAVGRLDINTSGLLILTTDGELAHRLMHPSYKVTRTYSVRVYGEVTDQSLEQLRQGVMLDDGMAHFENIEKGGGDGKNAWYQVSLSEGRNREVRRLWESTGVQVSRLTRTHYGPVNLTRDLRRGQYRDATSQEVKALMEWVDFREQSECLILRAEKRAKNNNRSRYAQSRLVEKDDSFTKSRKNHTKNRIKRSR